MESPEYVFDNDRPPGRRSMWIFQRVTRPTMWFVIQMIGLLFLLNIAAAMALTLIMCVRAAFRAALQLFYAVFPFVS